MASRILATWVLKYGRSYPSSRKGVRWPTAVKAFFLCGLHPGHELLAGVAEYVVVDARLVPHLSPEELVDRNAEMLAGDVPEGDVDCADGAHDGRAAEVGGAVHVLPVVFDEKRVFTHEVAAVLFYGHRGRLQVAPRARFAEAGYAFVRLDLHQQVPVQEDRFNFRNLQFVFLLSSLAPVGDREPGASECYPAAPAMQTGATGRQTVRRPANWGVFTQ